MKKYLAFIAILLSLVLSSCSSTYFYSTLNSPSYEIEKVDNGDFLYQNDSLWIAHSFRGENAPIQITVFNKTDAPLYIDWSKSSLILNNVSHPYQKAEVLFIGDIAGVETPNPEYADPATQVSFIPPNTMTTHYTMNLMADFTSMNDSNFVSTPLHYEYGITKRAKQIDYLPSTSPILFSSYITVYTNKDNLQHHKMDFYLSNIIKTKVAPKDMPNSLPDRGDVFYNIKRPNNTAWQILGTTVLVAGAVAIVVGSDYSSDYED